MLAALEDPGSGCGLNQQIQGHGTGGILQIQGQGHASQSQGGVASYISGVRVGMTPINPGSGQERSPAEQ